jgi:membrane-bound lytic murein transglycosylase A
MAPAPAPVAGLATTPATTPATAARAAPRWVAADWNELPGWGGDDLLAAWAPLLASCQRPAAGWAEFCARALLQAPADNTEATLFLMKHLRPWRVQAEGGEATGLLTGYFEPHLNASRTRQGAFQWPLHTPPTDPALRRLARRDIDANPRFVPFEMAYLDDPVGVLMLQIQGSGRLQMRDGTPVRVSFAGHNEQAFESVARALQKRGELSDASWAGLRDWAQRNPAKVGEALAVNPRVVYFRAEALNDPGAGPRGAQGLPLTPGRSVAVDKAVIALGTPLWMDSADLRRLVLAQDTGSAINGAVRADFFWGWGDEAAAQAGRTRQPLRLWALLPVEGRRAAPEALEPPRGAVEAPPRPGGAKPVTP